MFGGREGRGLIESADEQVAEERRKVVSLKHFKAGGVALCKGIVSAGGEGASILTSAANIWTVILPA